MSVPDPIKQLLHAGANSATWFLSSDSESWTSFPIPLTQDDFEKLPSGFLKTMLMGSYESEDAMVLAWAKVGGFITVTPVGDSIDQLITGSAGRFRLDGNKPFIDVICGWPVGYTHPRMLAKISVDYSAGR